MTQMASHQNALLEISSLDHQAIPFDRIRNEDFAPAFDVALREARTHLSELIRSKEDPTFKNTIEGLENCSDRLDRVSGIFSNLLHAHTHPSLQALAREVMPKLADFSNDIFLDSQLFTRVKKIWEARASQKLDGEQSRLLEKTYRAFVRNGALLNEDQKKKLREIDQRLSVLGQQFSDNVLKATNSFELWLTDREQLAGLPESAIEAAEMAAKEKGRPGQWLVTLQYPSFGPFMQFSARRELREKLWRAYQTRAVSGDCDNRPLIQEITRLRHARAVLLGYSTHADFVLEERMASHPDSVRKFLSRLLEVSRPAAEKDLAELKAFAGKEVSELQPWDVAYYSEKLQLKKFDFDEEKLRPYFKLENVVEGVFEHARRLYGIVFKRRTDLPVYHPDVQVFEVRDEESGRYMGLFYADFFPRESKQGGAWMSGLKDQGGPGGEKDRPHISIVCNFTKPTDKKPSLLTLDEVRTLFHEFGHSLHGLLSSCRYRSLSGTNVYWDFVELPSQIMENWVKEKESLDLFARHYETGTLIPEDLVRKIQETAKFQAGWFSLRQLNFALLDMAWHASDVAEVANVEAYETEALKPTSLFPHVPGTIISCGFSHIFSGGYSAGYYSYKWAEVLDADAFEFFKEKGIFSREVSDRFKNHILSRGGTEHPMELYKKFRGREPDADALLRREGLLQR
jgi:peptidyl-dipeptidase Dcp